MSLISKLGYSRFSPYRNSPFLDIKSPNGLIDMNNTDVPLLGIGLNTKKIKLLEPRSGIHSFPGDETIREIPLTQNSINLNLPQFKNKESKIVSVKPYMSGFNPQPGINIHGLGAETYLNILNDKKNKLGLTGNIETTSVGYPGGVQLFGKPQFSGGFRFTHTFRDGGKYFQPGGSITPTTTLPPYLQNKYPVTSDIAGRGMSAGTKAALQPQIKEEQAVKETMQKTGASRPVAQQIRQQQTQRKSNVTVSQDNRTDYEKKVAQEKVDNVNRYRTEVLGIPEGTTQRDLDEANKYKERLGRILNVGLTAAPLLEGVLSLGARAIPMAGRAASRLVAPTATSTRQATIQVFNRNTNMYETRLVDVPEQIIPGRSYGDIVHKMKNLRKDLNISLPEHYLKKWFGARPISLERDKGLIISPEGRIWDSNTRYWLNREYGNTPDPLSLIGPNATQYARSFGKVISQSPVQTMPTGKLIFNSTIENQGKTLQSGIFNTKDLGQMIRNPKQYFTKPGGPQKFEVNFDEISRMNRGEIDPFGETGRFFTFGETPARVIDWDKVGKTAFEVGLGTGTVGSGLLLGNKLKRD
jgi:hypothetical protein